MINHSDVYGFLFRGTLAQDAINRVSLVDGDVADFRAKLIQRLPFDLIENALVESARNMALVYTLIAAFENSARKFIGDTLLEAKGAEWWDECVSEAIRKSADQKKKDAETPRYHGSRGQSMINYCQMGDLHAIINKNHELFTDYIPSSEWARQIFAAVERSRNVIMHSGELSLTDVERVAMNVRDWVRQVGG
jgi:hypothetical protein